MDHDRSAEQPTRDPEKNGCQERTETVRHRSGRESPQES